MAIIIINICIGPSHRMRTGNSPPATTSWPHARTSHYILHVLLPRKLPTLSSLAALGEHAILWFQERSYDIRKTIILRPVIASPPRAMETISAIYAMRTQKSCHHRRRGPRVALINTEIVFISHSVILISIGSIMCTGQITFLPSEPHTLTRPLARLHKCRARKIYRIRFIYFPSIN